MNAVCEVCGAIGYEHLLLCYHHCKGAHTHRYCLKKVLYNAPKEGWFCDECNHSQCESISQQPITSGIHFTVPATGITQDLVATERKALAPIRCQDFHSACSLEAETALAVSLPSHVQSKVITHNQPAPEHDPATFVSPSLVPITDTTGLALSE